MRAVNATIIAPIFKFLFSIFYFLPSNPSELTLAMESAQSEPASL